MNKEAVADCINSMNDFTDQMAKLSEFLSESDNKQISDISPILDEYILEIRTDCYMLSYATGLENNNEITSKINESPNFVRLLLKNEFRKDSPCDAKSKD